MPRTQNTDAGPLTRLSEQQLIKRMKQGDPEASRILIDHHKQRLLSFVWRIISNRDDAEDICQDAFLKAITAIQSFNLNYRFSTWLFTIAYRLCLNSMRRREPLSGDMDLSHYANQDAPEPSHTLESEDARQLKNNVWQAVDRLSPPQQAATLLFYRENLSCQEIAEIMKVPMATVKSHLFRARARLKELLEPVFSEDWQNLCNPDAMVG